MGVDNEIKTKEAKIEKIEVKDINKKEQDIPKELMQVLVKI